MSEVFFTSSVMSQTPFLKQMASTQFFRLSMKNKPAKYRFQTLRQSVRMCLKTTSSGCRWNQLVGLTFQVKVPPCGVVVPICEIERLDQLLQTCIVVRRN